MDDLLAKRAYNEWRPRLSKLLYFLDKYDSETGASALQLWGAQMHVMGYWSRDFGLQNGFVFGALTNNIMLCYQMTSGASPGSWADGTDLLGSRKSTHLLDITTIPYEFSCALPRPYLFALSRARLAGEPGTEPFAAEFQKVVTAALESRGMCLAQSRSITDTQRPSTSLSHRRCLS